MEILISESVSKRYFKKLALDGINITIESGKIVGLLGPNGSGKTTFLKIWTYQAIKWEYNNLRQFNWSCYQKSCGLSSGQ